MMQAQHFSLSNPVEEWPECLRFTLHNHFVYEDVVLDSMLMYDDLLIGLYKYCLQVTVEGVILFL
jgi:hypothetical protein